MTKIRAKLRSDKRKQTKNHNLKKAMLKVLEEKKKNKEIEEKNKTRNSSIENENKYFNEREKQALSEMSQYAKNRVNQVVLSLVNVIKEDKELAYNFVLEELDAASYGDENAQDFVFRAGIAESEYKDTLSRSLPEVENGPQSLLISISNNIKNEKGIEYAVKLRIEAIDRVMQLYSLGKYGVKSDDIDVVAQDAINEYKAYCKKPEKIDVVNLTRLFQMLGCYVDEPSEDLKKHLMLMKIISICDLKVRSYYIPKRIIELGFISDLAIFSLVDYNTWLNSIKSLIKTGIAVKEVEKCLDLAVLIEDFNGRKIINFAPAIYNVTNLLMSELPNSPTINSFRSEFTDLSLVSAAVFGNVRSIEKYKAWVFSKTS